LDSERSIVTVVGEQIAHAVENARLYERVRREQSFTAIERDRLARLHLGVTEMEQAQTMSGKLQAIAEGMQAVGWGRVVITLRDADLRVTTLVTSGLTQEEDAQLVAQAVKPEMWRCWLSGEFKDFKIGQAYYLPWSNPWVRENVLHSCVPGRIPKSNCVDWHPMDTVYIPLVGGAGDIIGLICLDDPSDGRKPTVESLQLVEVFAREAALAVEAERLNEETRYLKGFSETIVKGIAEAILLFDEDGLATFANPAAASLWGYPTDEIVGRHWTSLWASAESRFLEEERAGSGSLGRENLELPLSEEQREIAITNRQGKLVPTISSARKVADGDDGCSILMTFANITARKEAEDAIRLQADVLQARNEELDAFAHTAAHDLKAPLGYMVGFAELLLDEYDNLRPEERTESLRAIAKGGRRMASVIDELLLLASMRKLDNVILRPLDMGRLVDEVLQHLEYMIGDYGGEMVVPDEWPQALGTSMWVGEVWTNYISNALKYGGNPPVVELGATPVKGGQQIRFWVRDNGDGLTEEPHLKLFEPFSRGESVGIQGHGLGLSIVKRIVARLGGEVSHKSTPGEGSVFGFTLKAR